METFITLLFQGIACAIMATPLSGLCVFTNFFIIFCTVVIARGA